MKVDIEKPNSFVLFIVQLIWYNDYKTDFVTLFCGGSYMMPYLKDLLRERGILLCAPIPLSACRVLREYKLLRAGFSSLDSLTAVMLAVPYLTAVEKGNLSSYAVPRDYHGFFDSLFDEILPALRERFPTASFCGFADDSPIDERDAAARAGLGILGENGLLITEAYSSYVFLGEIITDLPIPEAKVHPVARCEGCGRCKALCPMAELGNCLSSLTQKKGELTEDERNAIRRFGTVWGCDRCQESCPYTLRAKAAGTIYTDVAYFKETLIPSLTADGLEAMSDEEFARRAYSWRGRKTVLRNLKAFEAEG